MKGKIKQMAKWNYRVFQLMHPLGTGEHYYEIRDTYYNNDGIPNSYSQTASYPGGGTLEELREDMIRITDALTRPVLCLRDGEIKELEANN